MGQLGRVLDPDVGDELGEHGVHGVGGRLADGEASVPTAFHIVDGATFTGAVRVRVGRGPVIHLVGADSLLEGLGQREGLERRPRLAPAAAAVEADRLTVFWWFGAVAVPEGQVDLRAVEVAAADE